jgi:hypothetical protein
MWRMAMSDPQANPWDDYRARRAWFLLAFVSWMPLGVFVAFPLYRRFESDIPIYVVGAIGMAFFLITGLRLYAFRCPRCQRHFFHTLLFYNVLSRRCMHCALPKWSGDKSATAAGAT